MANADPVRPVPIRSTASPPLAAAVRAEVSADVAESATWPDATRPDSHAAPLPPPPVVAGYVDPRYISRGGMGSVWRALQTSTQREVALKVMAASAAGSGRARARFEREVELA